MRRKGNVLAAASEMMKNANFDRVMENDRANSYKGGAFDGSIKHITGKLTEVAHDLSKTGKSEKSSRVSTEHPRGGRGRVEIKGGDQEGAQQGSIAEARRGRKLHR